MAEGGVGGAQVRGEGADGGFEGDDVGGGGGEVGEEGGLDFLRGVLVCGEWGRGGGAYVGFFLAGPEGLQDGGEFGVEVGDFRGEEGGHV